MSRWSNFQLKMSQQERILLSCLLFDHKYLKINSKKCSDIQRRPLLDVAGLVYLKLQRFQNAIDVPWRP